MSLWTRIRLWLRPADASTWEARAREANARALRAERALGNAVLELERERRLRLRTEMMLDPRARRN